MNYVPETVLVVYREIRHEGANWCVLIGAVESCSYVVHRDYPVQKIKETRNAVNKDLNEPITPPRSDRGTGSTGSQTLDGLRQ